MSGPPPCTVPPGVWTNPEGISLLPEWTVPPESSGFTPNGMVEPSSRIAPDIEITLLNDFEIN
jgi:hypothetical protein